MRKIYSKVSDLKENLHHLLHHALVASTLGLIIVIFESHGLLNWLDSASLRVAQAINPQTAIAPDKSRSVAETVKTVLISNQAYERVFHQESPLSRPVLRVLLEEIASNRPKVIAIDIDISPGPSGARSNQGQSELDQWLLEDSKKNTQYVLVTPFPVSDEKLIQEKYVWVKKMCEAGITFAYPHVGTSQGYALRMSPTTPSLGVLAHSKFSSPEKESSLQFDPCILVAGGLEQAIFLNSLVDPALIIPTASFGAMLPLTPDAIEQSLASSILWRGESYLQLKAISSGDIVFLGSSYDPRDTLMTTSGVQPGVIFHAATTQTLISPTKKISHAMALCFDVVLGITAGFLFSWGWKQYHRARNTLKDANESIFGAYVKVRAWLALNFLLLVSWLCIIFFFSAALLRAQIWASPAAMIIGVFVKALIASRQSSSDEIAEPNSRRQNAHIMKSLVIWDAVLVSPMLLYGAYLTFFAH
jgi:hypothetical protein